MYLDSNFLKAVKEEGYESIIRLKDNRKAGINAYRGGLRQNSNYG